MGFDTDNYVGLPYEEGGRSRDGVDCYGLVILVHREQFDIEPTDWRYDNLREKHEHIERQIAMDKEWAARQDPEPGDVGYIHPSHLCVYAGDGGALEASEAAGSVVLVDHTEQPLCNRLQGWYRHTERL